MTLDDAIDTLSDALINVWELVQEYPPQAAIEDLAQGILAHPKLFLQLITEGAKVSGRDVMHLLSEMDLAGELVLEEGTETRHVWTPLEPHVHSYRIIRLVQGEPLAYLQCANLQCLDSKQVDCPADLEHLPEW